MGTSVDNSSKVEGLLQAWEWDGNISTAEVVAQIDPEYQQQARSFLNAVAPSGKFNIETFYNLFDPNSDGWFSAQESSKLITGSEQYSAFYGDAEVPDGYDLSLRDRYQRLVPLLCGLVELMQQDHFFGDLGVAVPPPPQMTSDSKSRTVQKIKERISNEVKEETGALENNRSDYQSPLPGEGETKVITLAQQITDDMSEETKEMIRQNQDAVLRELEAQGYTVEDMGNGQYQLSK